MLKSLSVHLKAGRIFYCLLACTTFSAALAAKPSGAAPKAAPTAKVESLTGYKLSQEEHHLGAVTVYVTENAIRFEDKRIGLVVLSKAPDWSVVAFNNRARKQKSSPLSTFVGFSKLGLAVSGGYYYAGVPLAKTPKQGSFGKYQTFIYGSTSRFNQESTEAFRQNPRDLGAIKTATLNASNLDFKQTEKQAQLLCKLYGLPVVKEIPIEYTSTDHGGSKNKNLQTINIERSKLSSSIFQEPKGFKEVANLEAVRMDNEGEGALESMLEGLDENLGKHRKH